MKWTGNQFEAVLETNRTTKAMAKDVVQGDKTSGPFHGPKVILLRETLLEAYTG
jgi:hypothetical protein